MALVNLVGVQPMDFETDNGDKIKGIKLHITYQDDNVYGNMCDTKFLNKVVCENLKLTEDTLVGMLNQVIDLETNLKGKVVNVKLA